MARFGGGGNDTEAQPLIAGGGEHRALHSGGLSIGRNMFSNYGNA